MATETMPDSDFPNAFTIGSFFNTINNAFRKVDAGVATLDAKLEKVSRSARSSFSTFSTAVMKGVTAVGKMNDALEKQNRLIRNMPKAPPAPTSRPHPTRPLPTGQGTPPSGSAGDRSERSRTRRWWRWWRSFSLWWYIVRQFLCWWFRRYRWFGDFGCSLWDRLNRAGFWII